MRIVLNGEPKDLAGPLSVRALLDSLGLDARMVAVEVNRRVIRRNRHEDTMIPEHAEVEIVSFVGGGSRAARRRVVIWMLAGLLACVPQSSRVAAQSPQAPRRITAADETTLVAQGWAMLASGDAIKASAQASLALGKYPRSTAALLLLIEADVARAGALTGLDSYERWLGPRVVEAPYVLRRPAHALLWSLVPRPETRIDALQALAEDGDADARAELAAQMVAGRPGELHALVRMGDEGAVRVLIDQIETRPGSKLAAIDALVASRSALAVPSLVRLLDDANRPEHVAAAADGLGKLGAAATITRLRQVYADTAQPVFVRFMAAAGLYRMEDLTGLALLQQQLHSEFPAVRAGAAEVMSSHPDPEWQGVVRSLVSDGDPSVRLKAAELIAPFDNDLARGVLERLLSDPNVAIRESAARVLADRVAGDFGTLRKLMRSADGVVQVRAAGRILALTR